MIIGLGNIGAKLDTPSSTTILTHAHAYHLDERVTLAGGYDIDAENREEFMQRWGADAFESFEKLLAKNPQLLSICSPTHLHKSHLQALLQTPSVEYILCEKPFVATLQEFEALESLLLQSDKKMIINYIRHFDESFQELQQLLHSQEFGKIHSFEGSFSKGLFHNGSHMLDLIEWLIGSIEHVNVFDKKVVEGDIFGNFFLQTSKCSGVIKNPNLEYSLFELDIFCTEARVRITQSGHKIEIFKSTPSKEYAGYFSLEKERRLKNTLQFYAKNSLDFLLEKSSATFLKEQLQFSKKIIDIRDTLLHTNIWSSK